MNTEYDAIVVGASIAGCTTATLMARSGARVALVERHSDPATYKKTCTHYLQASSIATLRRLGLTAQLENRGAVHNYSDFWTRFGWITPRPGPDYQHPPHGYNIRRQSLEPLLRTQAAETPGVELLLGHSVNDLISDGDRVAGVIVHDRHGHHRRLYARLTVAADGRDSTVAKLARSPAKHRTNNRFMYWAYYSDLHLASGTRSQLWFLDPDCAYVFPNEDGVTVVAVMPTKARLPEFRRDLDSAFTRYVDALPDQAPPIHEAQRVSPYLGKLDVTNHARPAAQPGLAFVGDAATTSDPLWGVGCGWALQSAEWLADTVGPALTVGGDLDGALSRYGRLHRRRLAAHHRLNCDYSTGRKFNPFEKMLFTAAANDAATALALHAFASRSVPVHQLLKPGTMSRVMTMAARSRRAGRTEHTTAA